MKLTELLKDKVESVDTKEEKKAIIAEVGMELTDDEMEEIAGGGRYPALTCKAYCYTCGQLTNSPDFCRGRGHEVVSGKDMN